MHRSALPYVVQVELFLSYVQLLLLYARIFFCYAQLFLLRKKICTRLRQVFLPSAAYNSENVRAELIIQLVKQNYASSTYTIWGCSIIGLNSNTLILPPPVGLVTNCADQSSNYTPIPNFGSAPPTGTVTMTLYGNLELCRFDHIHMFTAK